MQDPTISNFQRWQLLYRDVPCPQSYVDWSWYYLVAASLQRRVWIGQEDNRPLYSNIYVVFVGPPACGKGISIDPVDQILRYWKLQSHNNGEMTPEKLMQSAEAAALLAKDPEIQAAFEKRQKRELTEEKLIIPVGANATTFESLCETIAGSPRSINYETFNKALNKKVVLAYRHCSLAFILTEIESLIKAKHENVVNLIKDLYDCKPYTYKTKTQGTDHIAKGCINMIAGTTFSYMEDVFTNRILNDGFASRTFFIVESKPRFYRFGWTKLDTEQEQVKKDIINYVKRLTTLYGECSFTPEAHSFIKHWWEEEHGKQGKRVNTDSKLESYYGRKDIHVQKLCMIFHWGEKLLQVKDIAQPEDYIIGIETVHKVMAALEAVEKRMHLALSFGAANPLARPTKICLRLLSQRVKGMTRNALKAELWEHMNVAQDFDAMMEHLLGTEAIEIDPTYQGIGHLYRLKEEKLEK